MSDRHPPPIKKKKHRVIKAKTVYFARKVNLTDVLGYIYMPTSF